MVTMLTTSKAEDLATAHPREQKDAYGADLEGGEGLRPVFLPLNPLRFPGV